MEASSPFSGQWRRCCGCSQLRSKGAFSKCSKCKVFIYCDIACQTKHWKAEHKSTCKVQAVVPPPLPEYVVPTVGQSILDADLSEVSDLDRGYQFIMISPPTTDKLTKQEWESTVRGVEDAELVSALATLVQAQSGSDLSAILTSVNGTSADDGPRPSPAQSKSIQHLQEACNWDKLGTSIIPGFSARYDGYNLRGLFDANNKTRKELLSNRNAGLLFMQPEGLCHGNVIVWCAVDNTDHTTSATSAGGAKSAPDTIVPITRRNILQTIEYNLECGFSNSVPERIHFENITKKAALSVFKKENFTMIDG